MLFKDDILNYLNKIKTKNLKSNESNQQISSKSLHITKIIDKTDKAIRARYYVDLNKLHSIGLLDDNSTL